MTMHRNAVNHHWLLVVFSAQRKRVIEVADRFELPVSSVRWARSPADLVGLGEVPIYLDSSFWNLDNADKIAVAFELRVDMAKRRRDRWNGLADHYSKALN